MSEAPERIRAWGHSGDRRPIRGFSCPGETNYDECGGVPYRRADLHSLPDHLIGEIKREIERESYAGHPRTHWYGCESEHSSCRRIRLYESILAAVERKP